MFKRWVENIVKRDISRNKSVLLIGSRRVGKTTLSKMIGGDDSTYHTFDDIDLQIVCKENPGYIENICKLGKINILDEVQKAPDIFDTVKLLIDKGYLFILTGSSALNLKHKSNETLAGRIRIRNLNPLCWGEETVPLSGIPETSIFFETMEIPKDPLLFRKGISNFESAIDLGGYPELVGKDISEKKQILKDYRNTYLQRDILELSNIQDLNGFRALLAALAQSIGSTVNYQNLANESGLSHVTVKKYLYILEQTFIIFKLYPYQYGPAKRYVKSPKWYFVDSGMLGSLNLRLSEGQVFENFVISEIYKRMLVVNLDEDKLFFYKSAKSSEVDLVIEKDSNLYLFKIKASNYANPKFTKHLKGFYDIFDRTKQIKSFVIYRGKEFSNINNTIFLPVYSMYGFI